MGGATTGVPQTARPRARVQAGVVQALWRTSGKPAHVHHRRGSVPERVQGGHQATPEGAVLVDFGFRVLCAPLDPWVVCVVCVGVGGGGGLCGAWKFAVLIVWVRAAVFVEGVCVCSSMP